MKSLLVVLALFAQGCASVTAGDAADVPLSPRELKADPSRYDGQVVTVRGYVILGTNGRSLCQSKQEFDAWLKALERHTGKLNYRDYDTLCLTMLNADLLWSHVPQFRGRTITIRGTFVQDYPGAGMIDLQAWGKNGIILDDGVLEQLAEKLPGPPGRSKRPGHAWR